MANERLVFYGTVDRNIIEYFEIYSPHFYIHSKFYEQTPLNLKLYSMNKCEDKQAILFL